MPEKTKTTVVIESHEQTIIRRSRRTISSGEFPIAVNPAELARLSETVSSDQTEPVVEQKRHSLGACLKTIAMKSATVLAPLSHRLKAKASERKTKQP
jgi:hypothetical protein